MTPEHPEYQRLKLHDSDAAHHPPTPATRTRWMRHWGTANLVIIAALLVFVMWSPSCVP
jgi:hypothetical protein